MVGPQFVRCFFAQLDLQRLYLNVSLSRNSAVISPITSPSAAMMLRPLKFASDSRMRHPPAIGARSQTVMGNNRPASNEMLPLNGALPGNSP